MKNAFERHQNLSQQEQKSDNMVVNDTKTKTKVD